MASILAPFLAMDTATATNPPTETVVAHDNKDDDDDVTAPSSSSSVSSIDTALPPTTAHKSRRTTEEHDNVCTHHDHHTQPLRFVHTNLAANEACGSLFHDQAQAFEYHAPPLGDNDCYRDNDTIFGKILRGEAPATVLAETSDLLAFEDILPRAPLHGLIIPKRLITNVLELTRDDVGLLKDMRNVALELLRDHAPDALQKGDFRLCFHVPPYNSVDHLHLHVLAPTSRMTRYCRWIKYNPRTPLAVSLDTVVARLEAGKPPVPCRR